MFPELYEHSGGNVKVEFDLSDYATNADLKGALGINTSMLASKIYLTGLKSMLDNLDIGRIMTVSTDLSKLSNVMENDVVKKTVYNKLVMLMKKYLTLVAW